MGIERIRGELVSFDADKKVATIVDFEEIEREPCSARTHTYRYEDESLISLFQEALEKDAIFIVINGIITNITFP